MSAMKRARIDGLVAVALLFPVSLAQAGVGVLQQSDGSSARITDLGNGIGIITDPHGTAIPAPLPPRLDSIPLGPQGRQAPETVTPFGSAAPPAHLTPSPVLPFNPNRTLSPSPSIPSSIPPSTGSPAGAGSSMERFSR